MVSSNFFRIDEASAGSGRRMPWIQHVLDSPFSYVKCKECSGEITKAEARATTCQLRPNQGAIWPDLLGSSLVALQPFSEAAQRVVRQFSKDATFFPVNLCEPIPMSLRDQPHKAYGWIEWVRLPEFPIDLKASGFMRARVCNRCGRVHHSISLTFDKQQSTHKAIVLPPSNTKYPPLFRLQGYGSSLFCSAQLKAALSAAGLVNLAFRDLTVGNDASQ